MRVSKVARLPSKLRHDLDRMWAEGAHTNEQLRAYVNRRGGNIKISSMGLYLKNLKNKLERYAQAQSIAAVWVAKLGREPQGNTGRLLLEMLRMVAFRQLADMGDLKAKQTTRPAEIAVLARAIREIETASKTITEREAALGNKPRRTNDAKANGAKPAIPPDPSDTTTLAKAKELVRGLL
jgi:hypothetical protein